MSIPSIILYSSILIWLLPPLKQFRGRFFYYFLVQALSDPIVLLLFMFKLPSQPFYFVKALFLILLLGKEINAVKKIWHFFPFLIIIFALTFNLPYIPLSILNALGHVCLLYLIFRITVTDAINCKHIKIFNMMFFLYELSIVFKYFYLAFTSAGMIYFIITSAFDIILGVFFTFTRDDSSQFTFSLEKP